MNTTQTDNGKKQETAKDILEKHNIVGMTDLLLPVLEEIADKAWEAALKWDSDTSQPHPDKSTFMKSLFPLKDI